MASLFNQHGAETSSQRTKSEAERCERRKAKPTQSVNELLGNTSLFHSVKTSPKFC